FTLERTHLVALSADGTHVTFGSIRNGSITSPPLTDSGPASRGEAIGAEVSDQFLQAPASLLLHNRRLCGGLADEVHFYAAITEDEWQRLHPLLVLSTTSRVIPSSISKT